MGTERRTVRGRASPESHPARPRRTHSLLCAAFLVLLLMPLPTRTADAVQAAGDPGEGARTVNATDTMTFSVAEVPNSVGGGFEPHILAAPGVDGRQWIYIDSPTGLGSKKSGNLYISKDAGDTWAYSTKGIVSGSWIGSGDSYTAVAKDGTIYFTDLLLVTATIQTSRDGGQNWVRNPVASVTPLDDRQWIDLGPTINGNVVSNSQTLYMVYNQLNTGLWIMKSEYTNLGIAWTPGGRGRAITKDVAARDLMAIDQHDGTIYLASTGSAGLYMYVSTDGATTFTKVKVKDGAVDDFENIFVVDAVDNAGNVYLAWTDQHNITLAASQDKGQSWRFMNIVSGNGTRVLPWVTAGDAGRVGVVWYETNETGSSDNLDNASWGVMAAVTPDAFADNVTFYESVVDPFVHYGTVRTTGASGSADRDLGDYMSCDVDSMGRLVMTFGNDGNDGANKYKSTVMYARQSGGPFLTENAGPVARFTNQLDGLKVTVDGSGSYDKNGKGISSYQWRWGDGTNTSGQDPAAAHTYKHNGHYNLTLVVTNLDNMTGADSVRLNVVGPAPPSAAGWFAGIGVAVAVAAGVYVWRRQRRAKTTKTA